jgi:hypothetical protein
LACFGYSILFLKYFVLLEQFCNFFTCFGLTPACHFFTAGISVTETGIKSCRACSFHTCSGFCARKIDVRVGEQNTHVTVFFGGGFLQHDLLLDKFIPLMNIVFRLSC